MTKYLLDTTVFSAIVSGGTSTETRNVKNWLMKLNATDYALSSLAVYESANGAAFQRARGNIASADGIDAQLSKFIAQYEGNGQILDLDAGSALKWPEFVRLVGGKHLVDAGMLAVAKHHKLVIATRNWEHFANRGVELIDPFEDPPDIHDGTTKWPPEAPKKTRKDRR